MLGAPMARAQLARARSGVCGHRKSRHSVQRLDAAPRARRRALGRRLCFRRPSGLAPMAAPCLRGGHPGRPQLEGAGGGGEGRGGDLMDGASRQVVAGDSLLVCPKTWRQRLAVQRAGVADRDEMMSSEVRRPTSLHLLLALTSSMSLRWSLCPQPTLGHQGNLSSCQLDDPQPLCDTLGSGCHKALGTRGRR